MRVALISTACVPVPPPRYGGTELVIAELATALVELGHVVTTYATGDSNPAGDLRAHFPRAVWPPDPNAELIHAHSAATDLRNRRAPVDVVHAHTAPALAFAGVVDAPIVYTVHHKREPSLSGFYQYFDRTEYVMISARQSALQSEIPNRHVIHHGIDPGRYALGRGDGGYVAFLGRFAREKAPHLAVEAAARADVPIVLAGEAHPQELAYFEQVVRPVLQQPQVRWLGEADHAKKQTLLSGARALLFPIEWEEPFGLVMIEAMMCGTPVIAFGRGSVPEVVDHGVTGFVVDGVASMADAIHRAAALDRETIRRRAEQRWSARRMALEYIEVYSAARERHLARKHLLRAI